MPHVRNAIKVIIRDHLGIQQLEALDMTDKHLDPCMETFLLQLETIVLTTGHHMEIYPIMRGRIFLDRPRLYCQELLSQEIKDQG